MYKIKKEKTNVEIELTIDGKTWEEGVNKIYETSKSKFNVVGFRKGHAPRKVIEKQYGDSVFFEDTVEYFVNQTLNEVLDKNPELEPVAMPHTHFQSFTNEDGLKLTIHYEIVPDFDLCEYKGVEIEAHKKEVTDKLVDAEIKRRLEQNAKFEDVEREVKNGDSVLINFEGFIDGQAFEGGAGENYPLEIGSHTFIDNFEEQLIGHKKGEVVDVNVTFPENYGAKEFQNKKALFKVTINQVREKVLPKLDDKFVADTTEFETVEEYRKDVFAYIQDMYDKNMEEELQFHIRKYLIEHCNIEIPDSMVEAMVSEDLEYTQNALKQYHISIDDYLAQMGLDMQGYLAKIRERTLTSIKSRYIYRKLIEQNKIEVSDEELGDVSKLDSHEIAHKKNEILLDKLFDLLKNSVKIKYVKE